MDLSRTRQYYEQWEDLLDDLQTQGMAQGFAFLIRRSRRKNTAAQNTRYDIACVCYGSPPPENPNRRRKEKTTMKCGCPFAVKALYRQQEQLWELVIVRNEHNHTPHDRPDEMCTHRRRLRQQDASFEAHLERLSLLGTKTAREVAEELEGIYMDDNGNKTRRVTPMDVTNGQEALRTRKYGPYSSTQIFLRILEERTDVFHRLHRGQDGKIDAVFFTFHWALQQWQHNHEVLSFDNTYRVNRFNMPLLQVTGTTALHTTFTVAFCLVSSEVQAAFEWPLEVLRDLAAQQRIPRPTVILSDMCVAFKNAANAVFPECQQQLCIWHILKNASHFIRTHWHGDNTGNNGNADDEALADRLLEPSPNPNSAENSIEGCIQAWRACVHADREEGFWGRWRAIQADFQNQQCKFYILFHTIQ